MSSKLEKLNQLNELLKADKITREEFETLKNEILNSQGSTKTQPTNKPDKASPDKEKITLKEFKNGKGKTIAPPDIVYLNFKDISDAEVVSLKPFLKAKQIDAPAEMTQDEIKITNKLFSNSELAEMNSKREGFNYAFGSIINVISAGAALYFIMLSPCFILLGGGTGIVTTFIISLVILNKADATKLDRAFAFIALTLAVLTIIAYFKWDSWKAKFSNQAVTESTVVLTDCSAKAYSYTRGYSAGKTASMLSDYSSCESYVRDYNEEIGMNALVASDCFCSGYEDGKEGKVSRYSDETKANPPTQVDNLKASNGLENTSTTNVDSSRLRRDTIGKVEVPMQYRIGQKVGGGIVFFISFDGKHGLIASKNNGRSSWQQVNDLLSKNSEFDGFTDWRLPSVKEFELLKDKKFAEFFDGEGSETWFWSGDATGYADSLMMYKLSFREGNPSKKVVVGKIEKGKEPECDVILIRAF